MNGWYNPDNWLDLADHLLLVLGATAVIAIPSWFAARNHSAIKQVNQKTETLVGQIQNGHSDAPPLRADLDRVIASIDRLGTDITAIRRDLADEESRRRDHIAELREEIHRRIDELNRRFDR